MNIEWETIDYNDLRNDMKNRLCSILTSIRQTAECSIEEMPQWEDERALIDITPNDKRLTWFAKNTIALRLVPFFMDYIHDLRNHWREVLKRAGEQNRKEIAQLKQDLAIALEQLAIRNKLLNKKKKRRKK